jgi:membrane glycosyltransferase
VPIFYPLNFYYGKLSFWSAIIGFYVVFVKPGYEESLIEGSPRTIFLSTQIDKSAIIFLWIIVC